MENLLICPPAGADHAMGPGHPECPERINAVLGALDQAGLLRRLTETDAPKASREQLLRAHSAAHIDFIRQSSPSEGLVALDADTTMNPDTLAAALFASGAVVHAIEQVCSMQARRAFCLVRPPGHHAERNRPMGFCFFNNVAVGAMHALDALGLARVAIVDFDVHHGNGTEDIFQDEQRVIMVSSFQSGLYPGSGETALGPNMLNVPLRGATDGQAARRACEQVWLPAIREFEPELILISAGFDAHREDPLAGLNWADEDYHWLTRQIVEAANALGHGRVVSALEGGYALEALGRSAAQHVSALIE